MHGPNGANCIDIGPAAGILFYRCVEKDFVLGTGHTNLFAPKLIIAGPHNPNEPDIDLAVGAEYVNPGTPLPYPRGLFIATHIFISLHNHHGSQEITVNFRQGVTATPRFNTAFILPAGQDVGAIVRIYGAWITVSAAVASGTPTVPLTALVAGVNAGYNDSNIIG